MSPVRAVKESAGRMNFDFRGAVAWQNGVTSRQGRDGLKRRQTASFAVVLKGRDRARHFIDHVRVLTGRVKTEVPWSGSRRNRAERWIVRDQRTLSRIELVNENFVQTQVRR